MDLITSAATEKIRSKSKRKKKRVRVWRAFLAICLVFFLAGTGWLYGTNQGLQLRRLIVGTVLATQHPQYVKYLNFLLSKSELEALMNAWSHPKIVQSAISKVQDSPKSSAATDLAAFKKSIKVDTINTANYTAKVMIIPDPTTIHVVATRYKDKGQDLADLLKENGAVAGINAGAFHDPGGDGSGGQMIGIVISNGKVLCTNGGRNSSAVVAAFLKDGQFITGKYTTNELLNLGVRDAISFGPQLIVNGQDMVTSTADGAWGWAPRTAIGQEKNGSIVMVITDGRFYWDKTHRGASMSDMVDIFKQYNVVNAVAMDGGGSTTMINDGKLQLQPATNTSTGMRYLPDAWVAIPH